MSDRTAQRGVGTDRGSAAGRGVVPIDRDAILAATAGEVRFDEPLRAHTTYRIGGPATLRNLIVLGGAAPHSDFHPVVALDAPRARFKPSVALAGNMSGWSAGEAQPARSTDLTFSFSTSIATMPSTRPLVL